jgi:ribonuclease HI
MEALGLLSGLMHLRTVVKWEGTIEWHMDSKSVIDTYTYKKSHRLTNAEWTAQRDKDVWEALILGKKYWTGRVEILHVEAHTDTKRDR